MNQTMTEVIQQPFTSFSAQTLSSFSMFLPRLVGALLVFIIGAALARAVKAASIRVLDAVKVSNLVKKTPVEHFMKNAEVKQRLEIILGTAIYWLLMLLVLHTTVAILGLDPLSEVLDKVLSYIPNVFSAILVLFLGVVLAGLVESVVKGAIRTIDGKAARLLGKISSYLVITITTLIAVSELGIASEYIMVLFIGLIAALSLGFGLALGFGGKDIVNELLSDWYKRAKDVS